MSPLPTQISNKYNSMIQTTLQKKRKLCCFVLCMDNVDYNLNFCMFVYNNSLYQVEHVYI